MARRPDPNARQALIAAARADFAKRGLHGSRIEDITAACGVSKGSFYLHFPSKESLFAGLVKEFETQMDACADSRRALTETLLKGGALTRREISRGSARYRKFRQLEEEEDLRTLEIMWAYRDVVEVLISGAQGTPFEGSLWKLVEVEAARVAEEFRAQQGQGTCRTDVPPEIFGAMIVGTYLLLAHRLCSMREKPELRLWARSIQNLIQQGASDSAMHFTLTAGPTKIPTRAADSRARNARRTSP